MCYFGPLAAQNDQDLLSYFHVTQQASSLVDFANEKPSFIFVARPGSGKTALVKWLEAANSNDHRTIVIGAESTRLSSCNSQLNTGDLRLLIATELYTALISEIVKQRQDSSSSLSKAKDFLDKGWGKVFGRFFAQRLGGIQIFGVGFTLNPEVQRNYLQEIRGSDQLDKSRFTLKSLATETKIALILDDPEYIVGEGLKDVTVENARRLGALLSVLAELHSLGVRVIVFLKEHILQNTRAHYTDFSHFADQIEGLEWTDNDLVEMLGRRVSTRLGTTWEQVFGTSQQTLQNNLFPYLVNGPRDLLSLCNIAGKSHGKIAMAQLRRALRAHKADKWHNLSTYYSDQWPDIDQFARAMVDALKREYHKDLIPAGEVNRVFDAQFTDPQSDIHALRKNIPWVDSAKWEDPPIDERLFVIGCLGYVFEEEHFYPWAGRDIERFRLADSHFISPVFAE